MDKRDLVGHESTFDLREGATIVLPANIRTAESLNAHSNPLTPLITTVWRETDNLRCHFNLTAELINCTKKIGLFIPENVQPGDKLRIEWAEGNCACAIPIT